jgi:antitoxin CptB
MRACDPPPDADPMALRRRRLLFKARHRGTRENDLLLGRFAEQHLGSMDAATLDEFDALLDLPDVDLFDWITGRARVPAAHDSALLRRMIAQWTS